MHRAVQGCWHQPLSQLAEELQHAALSNWGSTHIEAVTALDTQLSVTSSFVHVRLAILLQNLEHEHLHVVQLHGVQYA